MRLPQAQAIVRETMFLKGIATFRRVGLEEGSVKLRRYLLLPRLLFLAARAPAVNRAQLRPSNHRRPALAICNSE
jgi:hypothetical protein